jgi:hypothetical protein
VLALGSWLYRLQYGIWHMLSGGLGSQPDFSGWFDRAMVVGFYLPWLVALEVWLRWRRAVPRRRLTGGAVRG